jgi:hypothetical protein
MVLSSTLKGLIHCGRCLLKLGEACVIIRSTLHYGTEVCHHRSVISQKILRRKEGKRVAVALAAGPFTWQMFCLIVLRVPPIFLRPRFGRMHSPSFALFGIKTKLKFSDEGQKRRISGNGKDGFCDTVALAPRLTGENVDNHKK